MRSLMGPLKGKYAAIITPCAGKAGRDRPKCGRPTKWWCRRCGAQRCARHTDDGDCPMCLQTDPQPGDRLRRVRRGAP